MPSRGHSKSRRKAHMRKAASQPKLDESTTNLDEIDYKILECLQDDGRISNVELADRVGLSPALCLRRVSALEESGIIRKYVALVNARAVNLAVTVFVQISLDLQVDRRLEIFQ